MAGEMPQQPKAGHPELDRMQNGPMLMKLLKEAELPRLNDEVDLEL
jgi:hypothetical protein